MFCPLSPQSAHAPSTHKSWPISLVRHIASLCSSPHQENESILALQNRVAMNFGDPSIVARMRASRTTLSFPRQRSYTLWCPMEYHSAIFSTVQIVLSELESDPSFSIVRDLFGHDRQIALRAAWRNSPVSFMQVLSRLRSSLYVVERG